MKLLAGAVVISLLLASFALAASIDGKWVSERKIERDGETFTIVQTFDLKSDGAKLTGNVSVVFGDRDPFQAEVQDGKIDGNKFNFVTVMSTPNGEFRVSYSGTVEGDILKGSAEREGGDPRPFEAKRK
ncbi:MAG: hypothetical protein M1436_09820 [Acidobacteria bacterium]|nr:hypothetical protein [Acidobacteriota bacterium]